MQLFPALYAFLPEQTFRSDAVSPWHFMKLFLLGNMAFERHCNRLLSKIWHLIPMLCLNYDTGSNFFYLTYAFWATTVHKCFMLLKSELQAGHAQKSSGWPLKKPAAISALCTWALLCSIIVIPSCVSAAQGFKRASKTSYSFDAQTCFLKIR